MTLARKSPLMKGRGFRSCFEAVSLNGEQNCGLRGEVQCYNRFLIKHRVPPLARPGPSLRSGCVRTGKSGYRFASIDKRMRQSRRSSRDQRPNLLPGYYFADIAAMVQVEDDDGKI